MAERSIVYVVTAAGQQAANDALEGLGYGPGNIAMPASADGLEPAVGYYGHMSSNDEEADAISALGDKVEGLDVSVKAGSLITPNQHVTGMLTGKGWLRIEG